MTPATVDANTLITVLKAQRNDALDAVAMMQARILDLEGEMKELKKIPEEKPENPPPHD